jgi:hypothetical protein
MHNIALQILAPAFTIVFGSKSKNGLLFPLTIKAEDPIQGFDLDQIAA